MGRGIMQAKQIVSSLAVGVALTGVGLASGMIINNLPSQATTAQASGWTTKTQKRTLKVPILKGTKKSTLTLKNKKIKVHMDGLNQAYADVTTPKMKGYKAASSRFTVYFNDPAGKSVASFGKVDYYKTAAAPKSAKAVTGDALFGHQLSNEPNGTYASTLKLTGVPGYIVKTAAPKVKGYTPKVKTVKFGVQRHFMDSYDFEQIGDDLMYVKNQGYKVSKLTAKKSTKTNKLKVSGKVAVSHATLAKKHKATYAVISDYKGKTHVKLTKKNTFSKTIKSRKRAKTVTAVAAYRTKTTKNGKKTYVYHNVANKKKVTVKVTK